MSSFDFKEFVFKAFLGGLSCAIPLPLVVNPLEVIKIRLQIQGELANEKGVSAASRIYGADRKYKGTLRGALQIIKEERLTGLYKGFTPAAIRELVYAGIRFGAYDPLKRLLERGRRQISLPEKMICGAFAGTVGAAIATPADLLKADAAGPGQPRRYRSTAHAVAQIVREEGLVGLFQGIKPNTQRAMILSAFMMPSYDHTKYLLLKHSWMKHDNIYTHLSAAMVSGFIMTIVSSPIDVVKTRIMNSTRNSGKYETAIDCLLKTLRTEGLLGLYKGFLPAYLRLGPHTVMAFIIFEKLRWLAGFKPV